jgi:hypothetical protein
MWTDLQHDRKFGRAGREALKLMASHGWVEGLVVPFPGGSGRVGLVSLVGREAKCAPDAQAYLSMISIGFDVYAKSLVAQHALGPPAPWRSMPNRQKSC